MSRYESMEERAVVEMARASHRCIFDGCVATWEHTHGGFPGGHTNPADPWGPPILFTGDEPDEGVRDYNGSPLDGAS